MNLDDSGNALFTYLKEGESGNSRWSDFRLMSRGFGMYRDRKNDDAILEGCLNGAKLSSKPNGEGLNRKYFSLHRPVMKAASNSRKRHVNEEPGCGYSATQNCVLTKYMRGSAPSCATNRAASTRLLRVAT